MKLINMFNLETATQMWRCDVLVITTILNFIQLSLSSGLRYKPCLGRVRDWRWSGPLKITILLKKNLGKTILGN